MTDREELIAKVAARVAAAYSGSYRACFDDYDADDDGRISFEELNTLLKDCRVGNWITRGTWAKAVVGELDGDSDGLISWDEFEKAMKGG